MIRGQMGTVLETTRRTRRLHPLALAILLGVLLALGSGLAAKADLGMGGGGRGQHFDFVGQIESLPSSGLIGDWTVGGKTVHVTADTKIRQDHGSVEVGSTVVVEGALQGNGSINATKIEVNKSWMDNQVKFPGIIEALPSTDGWIGDWTISKVTVHVDASTTIDQTDGKVEVGAAVLVEGTLQGDGSVSATKIRVKKAPGDRKQTVSFCGIVEALPKPGPVGDWTVSSVIVHVTASTTIDETKGTVALQVPVRVKGEVQADLSVNATEIIVKEAMCGGFNQPTSMTFSVLHLKPTPDAPEGAEGVVITRALTFGDGSVRQDFKVAVEHLLPGTAYDVMIDSFNAGPIMTNDEGEGHLFLSTADIPGAELLPTELQDFDALQQVDVNASGGVVVLTGRFADATKVDRDHPGPDYLAVAILKDDSSNVLGMAAAAVKNDEQELVLTVWGLKPGETYTLMVDGTPVGDLTASERGRIQAEYSTKATGHDLPLPDTLNPVSGLISVELLDSGGTTVVLGEFQTVVKPELAILKKLLKRRLHR